MEPIISPWAIYFLGFANDLNIIVGIALTIAIVILVIFVIVWAVIECDDKEKQEAKEKELTQIRKYIVRTFYIIAIIIFLYAAVPSKQTIMGMIVAKNITISNLTKAVDIGKEVKNAVKNDIIEIIKAITNQESKKE